MLRSTDVGCGAYGPAGGWIARWTLVGGWPRCVEAPLAIADTDPALLAEQVAINRAITGLLAAVEQYEAAVRLLENYGDQPPPAWIDSGPDGALVESPAWVEWQAAQGLVAALDPTLLRLARTRAGVLAEEEAAYVPVWPVAPVIGDPCEIAADLVGGNWMLRPLSEAEVRTWPLRRRPALGKLAFAQLLKEVLGEAKAQSLLSAFSATLSLAADIDFDDVFTGTLGGPAYTDQLMAGGAVTAADVAALRRRWPLG